MLKNILGKIKSQKSSSINQDSCLSKNHELKYQQGKQQVHGQNQSPIYQQKNSESLQQQLSQSAKNESNIVQNGISKVTYFYNFNIPNIFLKIMACPISHFNVLPFSQRKVKQIDLKKQQFPQYLQFMKLLLKNILPTYNHLLINWYPKGVGIMHHFDGPAYKDKVVVISLGGPAQISFCLDYKKQDKKGMILLEDKSVHIFEQDAYNLCLHGIQNYKIENIYLKIDFTQSKKLNQITITNSSIDNLKQTYLYRSLLPYYKDQIIGVGQKQGINQIYLFCLSENGQKAQQLYGEMTSIYGNDQYNWKIQISRKERISITIREKFN